MVHDGRPLPLNVAEIELSVFTRQGLTSRVSSRVEFEAQVGALVNQCNDSLSKVNWQLTAADARIKLKRLYPSIING